MKAFLFDIDGCLTLPEYQTSILDIELIDQIMLLDHPIAFVTGRSDGWLRQKYQKHNRMNYLEIPTYIEFGLALLYQDQLTIQHQAEQFLTIREKIIQNINKVCQERGIKFEPNTWYHDYPDHGSLWVENKHVMLSIASNTNITPPEVHKLSSIAIKDLEDNIRLLNHHLGVDMLPSGWSKARATEEFLQFQDIDQENYQWFVFGDNQSDQEMMEGLSQVEFITTKEEASLKVRKFLETAGII